MAMRWCGLVIEPLKTRYSKEYVRISTSITITHMITPQYINKCIQYRRRIHAKTIN